MSAPTIIVFYVENLTGSAEFYARLLGRTPVDQSPAFAMFALAEGVMLGLWSRASVRPDAGGGMELVRMAEDAAAVDATHADWQALGVHVLQPPQDMEFGRNFLAVDPDGNRLRVLAAPAGA